MSFADLKKQSKLGSLTEKLVKEVEKMSTKANAEMNTTPVETFDPTRTKVSNESSKASEKRKIRRVKHR